MIQTTRTVQTSRDWFFGDLPPGWNYIILKFACSLVSDYGANIQSSRYLPTGIRFIRTTDLTDDGKLLSGGVYVDEAEVAEKILEPNDFLISRSGTIGRSFIYDASQERCAFAGYLVRFRFNEKVAAKYFYFITKSSFFQSWVKTVSIEATISNVNGEKYANFAFPWPPLEYQHSSVVFLEKTFQKLDRLIQQKEKMLQLIEEKYLSNLGRVIFRGVDPDVGFKASGEEWIGEIPAHWNILRAKNIFSLRDDRSVDGTEELLSVSHITGVTKRSEKTVTMSESDDKTGYKRCLRGDLAVNTLWAWMGAMGISSLDGIVSPDYHVYIPTNHLLPEYIDHLCRSRAFIAEVVRWSKGVWSSRLRLYPESFFEIRVPVPPLDEQRAIVAFLNSQKVRDQEIVAALTKSIVLAQERRTALISDTITGRLAQEETVE